jgi:hypothetical protein
MEELNAVYVSMILQLLDARDESGGDLLAPEVEEFFDGLVEEFMEAPEEDQEKVFYWANKFLKTEEHNQYYH